MGRIASFFCPICGKSTYMGHLRSIDWDERKPFGVIREAGGRGSFRNWEYIDPEEAPELFSEAKKRMLRALSEWLGKGWISEEELLRIIKR